MCSNLFEFPPGSQSDVRNVRTVLRFSCERKVLALTFFVDCSWLALIYAGSSCQRSQCALSKSVALQALNQYGNSPRTSLCRICPWALGETRAVICFCTVFGHSMRETFTKSFQNIDPSSLNLPEWRSRRQDFFDLCVSVLRETFLLCGTTDQTFGTSSCLQFLLPMRFDVIV